MGMREYPMVEPAAFLLYGEAAELIWAQLFKDEDGNPEPFDPDGVEDLAEEFDGACWSISFDGEVETLFPELAKKPLEESFDEGAICYIACYYIPSLFRTAYPDKEALRKEFEEKLAAAGVTMPEDFDWWRYIVNVNGTNFS